MRWLYLVIGWLVFVVVVNAAFAWIAVSKADDVAPSYTASRNR